MNVSLKKIQILASAMLLTLSLPVAVNAANGVSLKASIDSTTVVQGSKAGLRLEILKNGTDGLMIDAPEIGADYYGVEISDLKVDTVDHGNGRIELDYNYTIQAFDPGTITLPPFRYAIGSDTFNTETVTLKVLEVDLDTLTDINPMESVVSVPTRWYDIIPDWWVWIFAGIAAVGVIACGILLFRRKKGLVSRPEKITPPYDLAVMRLNDLQAKKLPQSGRDKEYYTELTDILRQYLDGRFGINAMEMSSTQIIDTLRHNKETRPGSDLMKQILEIADFVKFAKVRPLPDDNIKAFNSAVKFVEDSKPLPPVVPEEDGTQPAKEDSNDPKLK